MTTLSNNSTDYVVAAPLWTPPDAPFSERLFVGLFYLCSALIFLGLQLSVFITFLTYKDFRSHLCYRVMLAIALTDSLQLCSHTYGGLVTLFNNSFHPYLEKTMGALLNSMGCANWPLALLLALNRLLVFLPRKISARKERLLFNWLMAIVFAQGLALFLVYLSPFATFVFRTYAWNYAENDERIWQWVKEMTTIQVIPLLLLALACYMAIFGLMISQRLKMSKPSVQQQQTIGITTLSNVPTQLAPHERRLLLQALAQYAVEFSLCFLWYWVTLHPASFYAFVTTFFGGGYSFAVFMNFYWIVYNGSKPLFYMAINRTIRHRLLLFWRFQADNDGQQPIHQPLNPSPLVGGTRQQPQQQRRLRHFLPNVDVVNSSSSRSLHINSSTNTYHTSSFVQQ